MADDDDCPRPARRRRRPGYVRVGTLEVVEEVYAELAAEAAARGIAPIDLVEELCAELALDRRRRRRPLP